MPGLLSRILPRDPSFFQTFAELAENIHAGSNALVNMLENYADPELQAGAIKALEHKGDNLTHALLTRLNQSFVTPFDREDIYELASKIDDVVDLIDAAASRLVTYRVMSIRPGVADMARTLHEATGMIVSAVRVLGKQERVLEFCVEINRLENDGDRLCRTLIAQLFDEEKDPVQIIKWKEIIEAIETATDKCEDVANVLEAVTLKNA